MEQELLCKMVAAAEDVHITPIFRGASMHMETMGAVLGSNLRYIRIPDQCVHVDFLLLLASHCPHLNTLVIEGEPLAPIYLPMCLLSIDIRHPQLETLQLKSVTSRMLNIDCPNLTHLSTGDNVNVYGLTRSDSAFGI